MAFKIFCFFLEFFDVEAFAVLKPEIHLVFKNVWIPPRLITGTLKQGTDSF